MFWIISGIWYIKFSSHLILYAGQYFLDFGWPLFGHSAWTTQHCNVKSIASWVLKYHTIWFPFLKILDYRRSHTIVYPHKSLALIYYSIIIVIKWSRLILFPTISLPICQSIPPITFHFIVYFDKEYVTTWMRPIPP